MLASASGCGFEAESNEFTLSAFSNVGVQPDADEEIVPDATTKLPALLKKCGVAAFAAIDATDSFVGFNFRLSTSDHRTLDCIKAALPAGATLTENRLN